MSTITLQVNNTSPTAAGAATTPVSTDVGWSTTETISIRIVAWYSSDETDVDCAGINRTTVSAWNGISVTAGDYISFAFTHADNPPDHYTFYYQVAATWDSSNTATKATAVITQASATQSTVVVDTDDDTATLTFGASANSITIDPITELEPITRENTLRAYDGTLVKKDYVNDRLLDAIEIYWPITGSPLTASEAIRLTRWQKKSVRLTLSDSETGTDLFLASAVGKVANLNYLHNKGKGSKYEGMFTFLVETEVEENSP